VESSRLQAEAQFRATIDHMQQEIDRLESDNRVALLHAVSQAKLISMSQNDLETALAQIRSIEISQMSMHDNVMKLSLQKRDLQEEVLKLKSEQKNSSIDSMAQESLAATFEQACTYIRDLGSDQECSITNFKLAIQQMQEDVMLLEVEKRNALAQVSSQAILIATSQSDLEEARLRISQISGYQHEAIDSRSIIALLEERSEKLTLENHDTSERVKSLAGHMEITLRDLEQARLQIADLECRLRSSAMESSTIEQMQEVINSLEREKQTALAESERVREDAAAKEMKSFASFYAFQRLSLQNQSSKLGKCHIQIFAPVSIDPNETCAAQPRRSARYRTQGVISEIGIRSRRQCHALSIIFPVDSDSHRHLLYAYFMISWAQFVIVSKFHRQAMSIQNFRFKNRTTYFILRMRRNFLVSKFFTIWKANSQV
jgi:hypothetical protein